MPKLIVKSDKDSKMVKNLSGLGITQEQICSLLGMSRNTLTKYYTEELVQGKAEANASVSRNLFRIATGDGQGAVTAGIFWLKCQAGWKDTNTLEVINSENDERKFERLLDGIRDSAIEAEESNTVSD
tara:strand:+ start:177 stop:560 length:384 start_codon:yes stop_codon:yes gene_type:complete